MIVVDASAAVSALLNAGHARAVLAEEQLHAPHLVDSEVAHVVRRKVAVGVLGPDVGWAALDTWRRLGVLRYPAVSLVERVWSLREDVSAYDATYVALAEALGCGLLTADAKLARAPDVRCPITLVPS